MSYQYEVLVKNGTVVDPVNDPYPLVKPMSGKKVLSQ